MDTSTIGSTNAAGEGALRHWLAAHDPQGATPYAPTGEYCTQYVEDAFKLGTGFDLYGAVKRDMDAHAPGFHLTGIEHDGYRYSSPLNAARDPYDSDNVAHYFANKGELHAWKGNSNVHVGDVLFLRGHGENGISHTAVIAGVDAHGRAVKIAESTGQEVLYRSWHDFQRASHDQGMVPISFGRVAADRP